MLTHAPLDTPASRRARARIIDLAREGPADAAFLQEVSAQLQRVIPFTAAFWSASDPLTSLATSPARVEHLDGQCERFWEREFLLPDVNLFRDLARADRPVGSLYRATDGRPMRSARYRELHQDLGYGDELRAVFRTGQVPWGMVSLWREDGQSAFSLAEEKLVADLSPLIAEAFRRAVLVKAASADDIPSAPGLLVFDADGQLESFNGPAEAWLQELRSPSFDEGREELLASPTEVRGVVALTHAIAAGVEQGIARAHVQGRSGRWLVIEGSPLRAAEGSASRTAVMIQAAPASDLAPLFVEAYDLTPREQQLTQLIARGHATAAIAERLSLSPHTVRDYVKSVFEKVGVSSRGELVARLFADHHQGTAVRLHRARAARRDVMRGRHAPT